MTKEKPSEARHYEFQIGGFSLYKAGTLITTVGAPVRYANLRYDHVQQFWALVSNDPTIKKACEEFGEKIADRMQEVGDQMGVAKERLTEDDVKKKAALIAAIR